MPNLPDLMDFRERHSNGDKVASWTDFHSCLHASFCSLFSSYCPRLTSWRNSQQDYSFTPLLFILSSYSSSSVTSFSFSSSFIPPSFLLFSFQLSLFLSSSSSSCLHHSFFPFFRFFNLHPPLVFLPLIPALSSFFLSLHTSFCYGMCDEPPANPIPKAP